MHEIFIFIYYILSYITLQFIQIQISKFAGVEVRSFVIIEKSPLYLQVIHICIYQREVMTHVVVKIVISANKIGVS